MNETAQETTAMMITLVEYEPWKHSSEGEKEVQCKAQVVLSLK